MEKGGPTKTCDGEGRMGHMKLQKKIGQKGQMDKGAD